VYEVPSGNAVAQDVVVYVVDDDESARDSVSLLLKTVGLQATVFDSPIDFIERFDPHRPGCVVLDLRMPELNGIETLNRLRERSKTVPVMFVTGHGDLSAVVRAMKLGAVDFFEKPVSSDLLLGCIQHWIDYDIKAHEALHQREATLARVAMLSSRERQVLDCVLNGMSNKETARHLGVGPKAIEIYRSHLMHKMEERSVAKLIIQILSSYKMVMRPKADPPLLYRIDDDDYLRAVGNQSSSRDR
jgi:FixJ family two-component response regulator